MTAPAISEIPFCSAQRDDKENDHCNSPVLTQRGFDELPECAEMNSSESASPPKRFHAMLSAFPVKHFAPYGLCALVALLGIGASLKLDHRQQPRSAEQTAALWSGIPISGAAIHTHSFRQEARAGEEMQTSFNGAQGMAHESGEARSDGHSAPPADKRIEATARRMENAFDRLAQRVDRLERSMADPTPTGSIAAPQEEAAGYTLQRVENGVAYFKTAHGPVEGRVGESLPKLGKIRAIEKRDGRWMVFTPTMILALRREPAAPVH